LLILTLSKNVRIMPSTLPLLITHVWLLGAPPPVADLYSQAVRSTAWVTAGAEGRGTGWLADAEKKWLITCHHVVGDAKQVDVIFPVFDSGKLITDREYYQREFRRQRVAGRVVRRDPSRDLALIELESVPDRIKPLPLVEQTRPGERVLLIGNRSDLEGLWGCTTGQVRQLFRTQDGYPWRTERLGKGATFLALQAPIHEGDSGGPVINERGELAGMTAAILWPAQKTAAAIAASDIRSFLCSDTIKPPQADRPADLYSRTVHGLAWVQTPSGSNRATGFILDREKKLLLTTAAASGPHERIELVFPKEEKGKLNTEAAAYQDAPRISARVIVRDLDANLALLEAATLPADTAQLRLAAEPARPGDPLHAIGNPNGLQALWVYSALSVRQFGKFKFTSQADGREARVLVLQAPGSGNDSGGPIVNSAGSVVAVAGGKDGEQQVSYGIDLAEIREFLKANEATWKPANAAQFQQRAAQRLRIHWLTVAGADFTEAIRLDPRLAVAHAGLAESYRLVGNREKAREAVDAALKIVREEERHLVLCQQAALLLDENKLDAALSATYSARKLKPKFAPAHALQAEALRRKKDFKQALADVEEAIWLDANLAAAYLCRGRIHFERKEFDEAIRDFSRCTELDPFDPQPLRERARAWRELANAKKGDADEQAASKLEKQNRQGQ
jgi:S1-C subfamily serine protease/Tfp pilus assembly protein PilF